MGHRIAILDRGRAPAGRRRRRTSTTGPRTCSSRAFIGSPPMNTVTGHRRNGDADAPRLRVPGAELTVPENAARAIGAMPSLATSCSACGPSTCGSRHGTGSRPTVTVVESLGHERHVVCRLADGQMLIVAPARRRAHAARGRERAPRRRRRRAARVRLRDRDARRVVTTATAQSPADGAPVMPADVRRAMRSARRRRRARETGVAAIMLAPSLVIFGVFVFYPFVKNFQLGFYRSPPFPGLPQRIRRVRPVSATSSRRREFLDSLWTTVALRAPHGAGRHRARPRCSPCSRTSSSAASASTARSSRRRSRRRSRSRR